MLQVRGKKNLVLEQSLAGPISSIVEVATLREYGVDKFFFLEKKNADTSQRNVVFIARGESGRHPSIIAGTTVSPSIETRHNPQAAGAATTHYSVFEVLLVASRGPLHVSVSNWGSGFVHQSYDSYHVCYTSVARAS
jgi:Sec1 family